MEDALGRTALTDCSPNDRGTEEGVRIGTTPMHVLSCTNMWNTTHEVVRCQVIDHSCHDRASQLRDEHRTWRNLKNTFSQGNALFATNTFM